MLKVPPSGVAEVDRWAIGKKNRGVQREGKSGAQYKRGTEGRAQSHPGTLAVTILTKITGPGSNRKSFSRETGFKNNGVGKN